MNKVIRVTEGYYYSVDVGNNVWEINKDHPSSQTMIGNFGGVPTKIVEHKGSIYALVEDSLHISTNWVQEKTTKSIKDFVVNDEGNLFATNGHLVYFLHKGDLVELLRIRGVKKIFTIGKELFLITRRAIFVLETTLAKEAILEHKDSSRVFIRYVRTFAEVFMNSNHIKTYSKGFYVGNSLYDCSGGELKRSSLIKGTSFYEEYKYISVCVSKKTITVWENSNGISATIRISDDLSEVAPDCITITEYNNLYYADGDEVAKVSLSGDCSMLQDCIKGKDFKPTDCIFCSENGLEEKEEEEVEVINEGEDVWDYSSGLRYSYSYTQEWEDYYKKFEEPKKVEPITIKEVLIES